MGPRESLVGSVTSQGGAAASIIPVLGFIYIWIRNRRELSRSDWFFIIGLLFIGFVGMKRAIWFIMPLIIIAFVVYENRKKISLKYLLIGMIGAPLILYFGLRLNPSLNPEFKLWGSFDLNYAFNFAEDYAYGDENDLTSTEIVGRNTLTNFLVEKFIQGDIAKQDWFGYGLRFMYATSYEEFAELGFYTTHKGAATGIFQSLIASGYFGVLTTLFFSISIMMLIKNKRFLLIILLYFLWEYFYYTGSILREYSLSFIFVYILVYADSLKPVRNTIKS
jgi:hypothetical protein